MNRPTRSVQPQVEGRRITEAPTEEKKSKFWITINTNMLPADAEERRLLVAALDAAMAKIALRSDPESNSWKDSMLKFVNGAEPDYDKVLKYSSQFVVEVGTGLRGGRVHAHWVLEVTHKTFIQISIDQTKMILLELLNPELVSRGLPELDNLYVHVRSVATGWNLEEYMRKNNAPG
jgi:hypothetical protein